MGSLHRISATRSNGSGGVDVRVVSLEETDSPLSLLPGRSNGSGGVDVRVVSVEETDPPLSLLPGVSEK